MLARQYVGVKYSFFEPVVYRVRLGASSSSPSAARVLPTRFKGQTPRRSDQFKEAGAFHAIQMSATFLMSLAQTFY